jgi:nitrite reductase/ring-hydroxylating ferredoxin subunit
MTSWRDHRHAPAPDTTLCKLDELQDQGCREIRYGHGEGVFSLLLCRSGNVVRAYVNSCPHFSLPLNARPDEFLLLEGARIMCAWHCSVFRLADGKCEEGPAEGWVLEPVPVAIVDGRVVVAEETTRGA